MNSYVMLKSNKYGLTVHLNHELPYEELLSEIEQKFKDTGKFFKHAKMAVSLKGRSLTKEQEQEIIALISTTANIQITCIIDTDESTKEAYRYMVSQSLNDLERREGLYYKGTLRRRQVLESETNIIILGDVEPGAKIIANGSVIVLGALAGNVHAGALGEKSAFVAALTMRPRKLRIGSLEARRQMICPDDDVAMNPKIATVDGEHIYLNPLTY